MTAYVDGNALAGALAELFAVDVTSAVGQCVSCGTSGAIAQAHVYTSAPGLVARCPACGAVVLRLVRGPGRAWLDLRGVTCLQVSLPEPPQP
jgi:Family of unknown function (DUF6510)